MTRRERRGLLCLLCRMTHPPVDTVVWNARVMLLVGVNAPQGATV